MSKKLLRSRYQLKYKKKLSNWELSNTFLCLKLFYLVKDSEVVLWSTVQSVTGATAEVDTNDSKVKDL